ncbi:hypothetical protein [Chamaesiphon polymorphus]|uniref:Uncharacterized protein n=1 Tax=Chamaesiphon polymorphus CCALA 037 TaxID=2107692 RepID=A0A2T1GI24_9CYAN|nr:hypothetical protein [Chamaesiphon polymorphus]PSB57389.1 hypothetical protein C7B77_08495 [Chamaesiphon polymorphus CCALA 037]
MKKIVTPKQQHRPIAEIETDLIDCLLAAPTIPYPWNPADPDTADYFADSDRLFSLEDLSNANLGVGVLRLRSAQVAASVENRSQVLFPQIQSDWIDTTTAAFDKIHQN